MATASLPAVLPIPRRIAAATSKSLRISPALVLLAAYWLAWLSATLLAPTVFVRYLTLFWSPILLAAGLLVWSLAFSRMRWLDRLWGVLSLTIGGGLAYVLIDRSLSRGLITQALPVAATAVVVWLTIAPARRTWIVRGGLSIVSLLSWGGFVAWSAAGSGQDLVPLRYNHPGLVVDLGVGLWAFPLPMDFDGDGDLDLVVSCPDRPYNGTYFFENPGGDAKLPVFKPAVRIGPGHHFIRVSHVAGQPRVLTPAREFAGFLQQRFEQPAKLPLPANVHTPGHKIRANMWHYVDYDGDGLLDIVIGVDDWQDYGWDDGYDDSGNWLRGPLRGYVYLAHNEGTTATGPSTRRQPKSQPLASRSRRLAGPRRTSPISTATAIWICCAASSSTSSRTFRTSARAASRSTRLAGG